MARKGGSGFERVQSSAASREKSAGDHSLPLHGPGVWGPPGRRGEDRSEVHARVLRQQRAQGLVVRNAAELEIELVVHTSARHHPISQAAKARNSNPRMSFPSMQPSPLIVGSLPHRCRMTVLKSAVTANYNRLCGDNLVRLYCEESGSPTKGGASLRKERCARKDGQSPPKQ